MDTVLIIFVWLPSWMLKYSLFDSDNIICVMENMNYVLNLFYKFEKYYDTIFTNDTKVAKYQLGHILPWLHIVLTWTD